MANFWGLLIVAAIVGWATALLARRHLVIVWAFSCVGLLTAWSVIASWPDDPDQEYDGMVRFLVVGFPVTGWFLGITATSVWVVGRRFGETSKYRSRAARS